MHLVPFLLIQNRLKQIASLNMVEYDAGQGLQNKGHVLDAPAAFIKINNVSTQSLAGQRQMAVVQIEVRLITELMHEGAQALINGGDYQHQKVFDLINSNLHKWRAILGQLDNHADYGEADEVVTGSLQRVFVEFPTSRKRHLTSIQRYQALIIDTGLSTQYQARPLLPILLVSPFLEADYDNNNLFVSKGEWFSKSEITYTYQWYKDDVVINGATNQTLAFTQTDDGGIFKCQVMATNAIGSQSVQSVELTIKLPLTNTNSIFSPGLFAYGIFQ